MKKRRIVIASVLKPVDDTRMFEKMGVTLSDSGKYEIFIVGYPSKRVPSYLDVHFLPLKAFSRISLGRLVAPLRIQKILHQVQPDILVVNTHELLIVAILNRILFGVKVVYDVRENYYRNILYSEAFPLFLRPLVAGWVRLKEKLTSGLIHLFFLSETGYKKEMDFFGRHPIIIENKVRGPVDFTRTPEPGKTRLLFSGTLAESTGVFLAINLAKQLHILDNSIHLTIIGFCAKAATLRRVRAEMMGTDFITLVGGEQLVPHAEIIQAIAAADFGLVCYPPSRHTQNATPTKLYEYLACRLPIILQYHPAWEELCSPYQACIPLDFASVDAAGLLMKMRSRFYIHPPREVSWESEAEKLLSAIEGLTPNPSPPEERGRPARRSLGVGG